MLERTYKAKHMEEAITRIKRELGPDAVILSSREVREGRGAGLTVEVTAAPFELAAMTPKKPLSNGGSFDARAANFEKRLVAGGVPMSAARTLAMRIRKELRAVRAALDQDIKSLGTEVKIVNIIVFPVLFALLALLIGWWRRSQRGAPPAPVLTTKEAKP